MQDFKKPFVKNQFYHVFNRGNNRENIFIKNENYNYFLKKYDEYLSQFLKTFVYCLLPNHFHFLVQVKSSEVAATDAIALSDGISVNNNEISKKICERFRRFFLSYAQAINKQERRTGSLFQKPFKRIIIDSPEHLLYVVYYIHANPQRHGITDDFQSYSFSSFRRFFEDRKTKLCKDDVFEWFGSKREFIQFHQDFQQLTDIEYAVIED
jgi:putative transposase